MPVTLRGWLRPPPPAASPPSTAPHSQPLRHSPSSTSAPGWHSPLPPHPSPPPPASDPNPHLSPTPGASSWIVNVRSHVGLPGAHLLRLARLRHIDADRLEIRNGQFPIQIPLSATIHRAGTTHERGLLSLGPSKWVGDCVADGALRLLATSHGTSFGSECPSSCSRHLCLSSFLLSHRARQHLAAFLRPPATAWASSWLGGLHNVRDNHWIAYSITSRPRLPGVTGTTTSVVIYSSGPTVETDTANLITTLLTSDSLPASAIATTYQSSPQQVNGCDCLFHSLLFLDQCLRPTTDSFTATDAFRLRSWLTHQLIHEAATTSPSDEATNLITYASLRDPPAGQPIVTASGDDHLHDDAGPAPPCPAEECSSPSQCQNIPLPTLVCVLCSQSLPRTAFSRQQLRSKRTARCKDCCNSAQDLQAPGRPSHPSAPTSRARVGVLPLFPRAPQRSAAVQLPRPPPVPLSQSGLDEVLVSQAPPACSAHEQARRLPRTTRAERDHSLTDIPAQSTQEDAATVAARWGIDEGDLRPGVEVHPSGVFFPIRRIVHRQKYRGVWHVLVEWENFGAWRQTLEPISSFRHDNKRMVREFLQSVNTGIPLHVLYPGRYDTTGARLGAAPTPTPAAGMLAQPPPAVVPTSVATSPGSLAAPVPTQASQEPPSSEPDDGWLDHACATSLAEWIEASSDLDQPPSSDDETRPLAPAAAADPNPTRRTSSSSRPTSSALSPDAPPFLPVQHRSTDEILQVIEELLSTMSDFSLRELDEFQHFLGISLENDEAPLRRINSALSSFPAESWAGVRLLVRRAVLANDPNSRVPPLAGSRETGQPGILPTPPTRLRPTSPPFRPTTHRTPDGILTAAQDLVDAMPAFTLDTFPEFLRRLESIVADEPAALGLIAALHSTSISSWDGALLAVRRFLRPPSAGILPLPGGSRLMPGSQPFVPAARPTASCPKNTVACSICRLVKDIAAFSSTQLRSKRSAICQSCIVARNPDDDASQQDTCPQQPSPSSLNSGPSPADPLPRHPVDFRICHGESSEDAVDRIVRSSLNMAPPIRSSQRVHLRRLRITRVLSTRPSVPAPAGNEFPSLSDTVRSWVDRVLPADSDPTDPLLYSNSKTWGMDAMGRPVTEADVRRLITHGTWSPALCDLFLQWWAQSHPGVSAATWIAPVDLLRMCTVRSSLSAYRVRKHGPPCPLSQYNTLWFPILKYDGSWSVIQCHLQDGALLIHGNPPLGTIQSLTSWLNLSLGARRPHSWTIRPTNASQNWADTPAALSYILDASTGASSPAEGDLDFQDRRQRAFVVACRSACQPNPRVNDLPSDLPTRERTEKVSAWKAWTAQQRLLLEKSRARRQALQKSDTNPATAVWHRKWTAVDPLPTSSRTIIITLNVGPRGLQVCLRHLPQLLTHLAALPMAIHLQDTKISQRRSRTIHDQLKRLLPDYTAFHSIRSQGRARRYNLGVTTLLRNDIALSGQRLSLAAMCPDLSAETLNLCEGRLLLLKSAPAGAKGAVWHLNVYMPPGSASAASRAAMYTAVDSVLCAAAEQGAAVVSAGDFNATSHDSQRRVLRPTSQPDRRFRTLIHNHSGAIALRPPQSTSYSWEDLAGRAAADLDHVLVFPAAAGISERTLLPRLEPGLDHLPVMAKLSEEVMGSPVRVEADPNYHRRRVRTQEHHQLLPAVSQSIAKWWSNLDAHERDDNYADPALLEFLLRGATDAYALVAGWTGPPVPGGPRLLRGHKALLREMDCLFTLRKHLHSLIQHAEKHQQDSATLPADQRYNVQYSVLRRRILQSRLLAVDTPQPLSVWRTLQGIVATELDQRRFRYKKECDKHQQQQLDKALKSIRDSFGKRRRTFKQALMRNPPNIPLWGVLSSHPDTVVFHTLQWETVRRFLPDQTRVLQSTTAAGLLQIQFQHHADLASVVTALPHGECTILDVPRSAATLVADPDNKLCGIENFFGVNALGALPRCSRHLATQRSMVCISKASGASRELIWYCNECRGLCSITSPPLQSAEAFLPVEVFRGHNAVDPTYNSHLRDEVSEDDFLHVVRTLPLRKAPGPDGIPNEVLRLLPASLLDRMRGIVNAALVRGEFPASWKDVEVTLMTKKPPAELLSNQRPIALCNTVYKLFTIILTGRLNRMVEENGILETEQEGGRRHRSTLRQLQRLDWQFQDARRRRQKIYSLWIDTTNAFCTVNHRVLWSVLKAYGIPGQDVDYLERLYSGSRFSVQGPFGRTGQVHTHAGVNQGDVASPLLWNLVVNALLRYLNCADVGYKHGSGISTSALAFIDDCALLSGTAKGMSRLVRRLNRFYSWAGLSINNSKCAICAWDFKLNKQLNTDCFTINGQALPALSKSDTYKYLGLEICVGGSWHTEKMRVRRKLAESVSALKTSPYQPHQLEQVVRACLLPTFRYGAALVPWTDRELDSITSTFANGRRLAWKLPPGSPTAMHTLSTGLGGGAIPHARLLWAKEMHTLLTMCRAFDDDLNRMLVWEWTNSRTWIGCDSDEDAADELTAPVLPILPMDLCNRFRRVCRQLGTTVSWDPPGASTQRFPVPSMAGASRKSRSDWRAHGESLIADAVPVQRRVNRALRVLRSHGLLLVSDLRHAGGAWLPFTSFPRAVRTDQRWDHQDLSALQQAIEPALLHSNLPGSSQTSLDGIVLPGPRPVPRHRPGRYVQSSTYSPLACITHVSDYSPVDDSYLCHYGPPDHKLAHCLPTDWDDSWTLATHLTSFGATVHVPPDPSAPAVLAPFSCVASSCPSPGEVLLTLQNTHTTITLPLDGYHGVRTFLPPMPLSNLSPPPPSRLSRSQHTAADWQLFAPARLRYHSASALMSAPPPPPSPPSTHLPPPNPTTLTHHFAHPPTIDPDNPTFTNFRQKHLQSASSWHACQRSTSVQFDLRTMDLRDACPPQGTWTAKTRHGQTVLRQHPENFHPKMNQVKPRVNDITLDTAHLLTLVSAGASLADVADACSRQPARDKTHTPWLRSFTSTLSVATQTTTFWGCTSITWDNQFPSFVSPDPHDRALGSLSFDDALVNIGNGDVIDLEAFTVDQQARILGALKQTPHRHYVILSRHHPSSSSQHRTLSALASPVEDLLPGQGLCQGLSNPDSTGPRAEPSDWTNGNLRSAGLSARSTVWLAGQFDEDDDPALGQWSGPSISEDLWDMCWRPQPTLPDSAWALLRPAAQFYWLRRQDGHLRHSDSAQVAACDGSAGHGMGAAAVILDTTQPRSDINPAPHSAKVGGPPSSFRAEAGAMFLALDNADPDASLTVLTDSMNIIQALQCWGREEYQRDMERQKNADIIKCILDAINLRSAPLTITKVKSHRGVELNELADHHAGAAAAAGEDDDIDTIFMPEDGPSPFTFTWLIPSSNPDQAPTRVASCDLRQVHKRWTTTSAEAAVTVARHKSTMASDFFLQPDCGRHLLAHSKRIRPWSWVEERRWMQLVGRTFPVNSYLHRIGKHPSGDCPWCPGVRETITHFQSCCPEFAENRTAAHHAIARATVSAIKDLRPKGWEIFYETPLSSLPVPFQWADESEQLQEQDRRPDGVAYHKVSGQLVFLEFTRSMDHPHTLAAALQVKSSQYAAAERAAMRAQRSKDYFDRTVVHASTAPFIFGVRCSVLTLESAPFFRLLDLTTSQESKVLAHGVRAAIGAASDLCAARMAARKRQPPPPGSKRTPGGRRKKAPSPPLRWHSAPWRADRGM